jgi:serine/threonine protein kinase
MDIEELKKRFEAYAAGTSSGAELRAAVADALRADPESAATCMNLAAQYFRGAAADQGLRDSILADIAALLAMHDPTAVLSPAKMAAPSIDSLTMLRSSRRGVPTGGGAGGAAAAAGAAATPRGPATRTGTGSDWDSPERLNEPAELLAVGSVLKGRYELETELARGGMGIVYKALDRENSEFKDRSSFVAIKVLGDEFKRHPLAIKALAREAKKALKLAHPNVVTVYNFTRDGGNVFIVMELLEGRSLDQVLKSEGGSGLPLARVLKIVRSLGEALSYAHEQGIVHADFKPSNAFITNDGAVKVLDFGIARAAHTSVKAGDKTLFDVSQLNALSPAYASLEMHLGQPPDVRDDVYSLACVTYELLTGHHPFNRIDAAKARQANLRPVPVRGLPRAKWRALRHALEFECANRTASVAEFVAAFCEAPRSYAWTGAVAAIALIAAAAVFIVPRQLESNRAHQRAATIAASSPDAMPAELEKLKGEPTSFRDRVLLDDSARRATIAYYQAQVAELTTPPRMEYAKAHEKLAELKQLLPDSSTVLTMSQELSKRGSAELARLLGLRDRAVRQSVLIPEQGADSLDSVVALIRQVDPSNPALTDPSVPQLYYAAAKSALDGGNPDLAHSLAAAGVHFAPNDGTLLDLQERVDRELQRIANIKRQNELEQRLAALNPAAPEFLDKVLANREDIAALAAIAPDSAVVKRIESSLDSVVALRVKQRLASDDVAGARVLLRDIGDLMPESAVSAQRDLITRAATASQSKAFDMLERLRTAALDGRLDKTGATGAQDLYAQLQRSGSSSDVLADARDYMAYGYLKEARKARFAGDRQRAESELDLSNKLQPGDSIKNMVDGEQQQLDAAGGSSAAEAAASKIDSARGQFAQSLRSATLGAAELSAVALALDRLESLGAPPQEIASGLSRVEDVVLQEIQRLNQQAGADPQQLAQRAALLFPSSDRLAEAIKQFRDAGAAADLKKRLDALLAQPSATDPWVTEVKDVIRQLQALVPAGDPAPADARRKAAAVLARAASDARAARQPKDEKRLMAMAREIDPDARPLADASAATGANVKSAGGTQGAGAPRRGADTGAADEAAVNQQRMAAVDALKQRLESQSEAGDIVNAALTANHLSTVLNGDIYVVRDVPKLMISAYVNLAQSQFANGKPHDARQTLAAGARLYGDAPEFRSLQARYAQASEEKQSAAVTQQ